MIAYNALPTFADDERIARTSAFYKALKTRRTCRDFADTPVLRAVIENALMAAGTAPSGANHQPWHFAVISSPEKKRALRNAAETEEREFYAGKASQEWIDALAPLGTDDTKP
jgi:nitroreductase